MQDADILNNLVELDPNGHARNGALLLLRAETKYEFRSMRLEMNQRFDSLGHKLDSACAQVARLTEDMVGVKADLAGVKQDVSGLKKDVSVLKQDVAGLKQDVSVLKQDVAGLKQDVSVLKQDVAGLKQDVSVLKQDVGILKNDMVDVKGQLRSLNEKVDLLVAHATRH